MTPRSDAPRSATGLRLLSWNVRHLLDDRSAVVEVVRRLAPDVVCVQETPGRWARGPIAELAASCGLSVAAGGPRAHGVAVLTGPRVHVLDASTRTLSVRGSRLPRGLARARVVMADATPWTVGSFHLGLDEAQRLRHVGQILRLLGVPSGVGPGRWALAGDLNETDQQASWQRFVGAGLTDAGVGSGATFPARRPQLRIDTVFVGDGTSVTATATGVGAARVPEMERALLARATDHLPLLVDLPSR